MSLGCIAATKASAVSWPTPGIVISRRQAAEALFMRLMSASIAATVVTAVRAAIKPRKAAENSDPFADFESLFDEDGGECEGAGSRTRPRDLGSGFLRSPAGRQVFCASGAHEPAATSLGARQIALRGSILARRSTEASGA
jgi:hypothetical protein